MPLHVSNTVVLIIRRLKLYYTASGIVTPCRWHKILFYNKFIIVLYMFRALLCSSSRGQNCIKQHVVSSHPVGGRPVHRLREETAKQVHRYKNTNIKLYKNNAAIWYNKTCRTKQLIPTCVNIRVNGNNPRCQRTKNATIHYSINRVLSQTAIYRCDDTRCCIIHL